MYQKNKIQASALRPSAGINERLADAIAKEIEAMSKDVLKEMKAAFIDSDFGTMDASPVSQARIRLNKLADKWQTRFDELAKNAIDKMINSVMRNSGATLKASIGEWINPLEIDRTATNERLKEVIKASTQEAAQLIKRIPSRFLDDVQGQVMRSITSGNGMKDLVPYLTKKYKGDIRWARHVAMDQTRKAYANINQVRLQQLGVEEYKWVHTGGSRYPREYHKELSGKIFRYDDPPVIDKRTGEKGKPGDAIFCRCIAVPIIKVKSE